MTVLKQRLTLYVILSVFQRNTIIKSGKLEKQVHSSPFSKSKENSWRTFRNVLCLIKAVLRTSWWNQCFVFFLTFLFLTDLLSSGVRSKVVKGQRTYRLFAGA